MNDEWAGNEITFGLAPRAVARVANLSLATLRRRLADGSISVNDELSSEETLFVSGQELERLAKEPRDGQPCEIEYLTPTVAVLEVAGKWEEYGAGEPIAPDVLARYCRPPGPRKRGRTAALETSLDEREQTRIAHRDFDARIAVGVPVPFPRSGDCYIALQPVLLQDRSRAVRQLQVGDLVHADEAEAGGRGIDNAVANGQLAKLPADQGVVALAGALLERVWELEDEVEQLEGRLERAGGSS